MEMPEAASVLGLRAPPVLIATGPLRGPRCTPCRRPLLCDCRRHQPRVACCLRPRQRIWRGLRASPGPATRPTPVSPCAHPGGLRLEVARSDFPPDVVGVRRQPPADFVRLRTAPLLGTAARPPEGRLLPKRLRTEQRMVNWSPPGHLRPPPPSHPVGGGPAPSVEATSGRPCRRRPTSGRPRRRRLTSACPPAGSACPPAGSACPPAAAVPSNGGERSWPVAAYVHPKRG
ncbi:MAG: hypothetical protein ACI8RZ_007042, partial [Myxococcota bacterium]